MHSIIPANDTCIWATLVPLGMEADWIYRMSWTLTQLLLGWHIEHSNQWRASPINVVPISECVNDIQSVW
jgi:hypothetical protein